MAIRAYSILVDVDEGASLEEVSAALSRAGVEITEQLDAIGVVRGRIDDARLSEIRKIPGVAAIEEERQVGPA